MLLCISNKMLYCEMFFNNLAVKEKRQCARIYTFIIFYLYVFYLFYDFTQRPFTHVFLFFSFKISCNFYFTSSHEYGIPHN